ncbi:GTPase Era [Agriterribacter sp.]|uniref:GTPase Era n=1 Tax=Agriterribacter sp. TaxID=2821509 RepID=UPI002BFB72C1|nr:GTPase Era [Agriterribacter sp.]HRO47318.1 GTPase Era [Agriterribacter sp.]
MYLISQTIFVSVTFAGIFMLMKVGFVNIFGKPNAGKSTLLNALIGEKLAIVSPKVQTTRHRIKGFLNSENYQVIFSDTPGIIEPRYKLHEKMMHSVKNSLEDADLALLLVDVNENLEEADSIFSGLRLKVPAFVVLNKIDRVQQDKIKQVSDFFNAKAYCKKTIAISALKKINTDGLLHDILEFLPEGEPFYDGDDLTDLPTRFFVGEMIREKIFDLFQDEIPYHTAVVVREFKEKISLIKITAEIIVHRESQKAIILGEKGKMIRQIGTTARQDIEKFLDSKVFLELFVKVRPKWRDNDIHLKEYGY